MFCVRTQIFLEDSRKKCTLTCWLWRSRARERGTPRVGQDVPLTHLHVPPHPITPLRVPRSLPTPSHRPPHRHCLAHLSPLRLTPGVAGPPILVSASTLTKQGGHLPCLAPDRTSAPASPSAPRSAPGEGVTASGPSSDYSGPTCGKAKDPCFLQPANHSGPSPSRVSLPLGPRGERHHQHPTHSCNCVAARPGGGQARNIARGVAIGHFGVQRDARASRWWCCCGRPGACVCHTPQGRWGLPIGPLRPGPAPAGRRGRGRAAAKGSKAGGKPALPHRHLAHISMANPRSGGSSSPCGWWRTDGTDWA